MLKQTIYSVAVADLSAESQKQVELIIP
jgi:hypothetical protein